MKNFWSWISTILFGALSVVFIWTFALSVPIYSRYVYYSQVKKIAADSGYEEQVVKTAYNDIMDYLTLHKEFKTGELSCSVSAKEHFEDCQKLFDLNIILLATSAICLIVLSVLASKKVIKFKKIGKFNIWFYSAIVAVTVPLVFGIMAIVDFDKAFELFHRILFPGKTNWIFNPEIDQVINILPESYFSSCGAMIAGIVVSIFVGIMMWEIVPLIKAKRNKSKKADK